jgi:hypothetical protein
MVIFQGKMQQLFEGDSNTGYNLQMIQPRCKTQKDGELVFGWINGYMIDHSSK